MHHAISRLTREQRKLAADYWPLALSLARPFKLRFPDLADDFDSAVAFALIGCARRYDGRINFATYARHRMIGSLLSLLVHRRRGVSVEAGPLGDTALAVDDDGPDQVDQLEAMNRILDGEPPELQRLLISHHVEGRSQRELAREVGCSQAALNGRLRNSRKRIAWRMSRPRPPRWEAGA